MAGKFGFIAFWKHTDKWYDETPEKRRAFVDRVNEIIGEAREKGVVTSSVYDCSWSCQWRFFSFWECPTLEILEETMDKLVACGDVNLYNCQHHFIGREVLDSDHIDSHDLGRP